MLKPNRVIISSLAILGMTGLLVSCGGGGGGDDGPVFDPNVAPWNVEVVSGDRYDPDLSVVGSQTRNTISWEYDGTATGFRVYYSTVAGSSPNQCVLSEYDEVVPTYTGINYVVHTDVTEGQTYFYCVVAVSGDQTSVSSEEVFGIPQVAITEYSLNDVVWNGVDTLVAVGESGVILTSPSGTRDAWDDDAVVQDEGVTAPISNALKGLTWDLLNGYLAVGGGGTILSSLDGDTWELENTNLEGISNTTLEDVAWTGSEYIVVGESGTVLSSPSGLEDTWIQEDMAPELTNTTLNGVAVGGDTIVISGTNGKIYTILNKDLPWYDAIDESNWNLQTIGNNNLNDVTWNGTRFGIVGSNDTVLSSPDGITWTEHVPGTPNITFIGAVQWDSGLPANPILAAVGSAGTFAISPDAVSGYNVPTHDVSEEVMLNAITWVDDGTDQYFVIVGNDGTVLTNQQ